MRNKVREISFLMIIFVFYGCSQSIPACSHKYTNRGDSQAIKELMTAFKASIDIAKQNKNVMMLSRIDSITEPMDFYKVEEWVCGVQKKYGKPVGQ